MGSFSIVMTSSVPCHPLLPVKCLRTCRHFESYNTSIQINFTNRIFKGPHLNHKDSNKIKWIKEKPLLIVRNPKNFMMIEKKIRDLIKKYCEIFLKIKPVDDNRAFDPFLLFFSPRIVSSSDHDESEIFYLRQG